MSQQINNQKIGFDKKSVLFGAASGIIIGAGIASLAFFMLLPSMMVVTQQSKLDFDETVSALEQSIEDNGWVVSTVMDMNKSMAAHGVEFEFPVKIIKLCNPNYAKEVLQTDRYIASMMPCSFAVWKDDNNKTYISKMNTSLLAKMFGGNIARVMGDNIAADEYAILSSIVKD